MPVIFMDTRVPFRVLLREQDSVGSTNGSGDGTLTLWALGYLFLATSDLIKRDERLRNFCCHHSLIIFFFYYYYYLVCTLEFGKFF